MPTKKSKPVREVHTLGLQAHWTACAEMRDLKPGLYDMLQEAYKATSWPPIGQEGAYPFELLEVQPVARAELFLAIWNELVMLEVEDAPTGVQRLTLTKRLIKGLKLMLEDNKQ